MKRKYIISSTFRSAGYNPVHRVLEVEFLNGTVYQYSNVPPEISSAFMDAGSHGRYYNSHIRDRYPYRQIR